MKKLISGCLAAAAIAALLSGCSTESSSDQPSNDCPTGYADTVPTTEAEMDHSPETDEVGQSDVSVTEESDDNAQKDEIIAISSPEELMCIEQNPAGSYILANDIDLLGYSNWSPLCSSDQPFAGTLDGNGYCIRNLNVDMKYAESIDDSEYAGLFCCVAGATIKNLGIVGGTVRISSVSNHGVAGALAGSSQIRKVGYDPETLVSIYRQTEVINCWVTATVESNVPKDGASHATMAIGAFFGEGCANFTNCYNAGKLAAAKKYADQIMGGFIGRGNVRDRMPMTITSCYNLALMTGMHIMGDTPGGFVGYTLDEENIDIVDSYYGRKVTKAVTDNKDTIFTSVKGLTVDQLKDQTNFAGFDFNEVWAISPDVNDGYPYLRVQRSTASEETTAPAPEVQEPAAGTDRTAEELRKAILGEWMEDGMAVNYYAFFADGSCKLLFQNSEPGTFEITEDRTLKFTTSWTNQTMEWNPESLYDLEGWYLTPEGKLIIEGNVLNRL